MRYFFGLIFTITFLHTHAQSSKLNSAKDAINTYAAGFPQEKLYLHFDKPSYTPGETIWFKAYIFAGSQPGYISKTLYIDFIDAGGRIVKHCVQPVFQSTANGNFDMPLEFKGQLLFVKAYTRWMLNFDSSFLYHKTLHINQTVSKKQSVTPVKSSIRFLPEGGDLVEGMESRLAFKAIHFDGRPARATGIIINSKNEQVAEIKTTHDGMGLLSFEPKQGETYIAKWKDEQGNNYQTPLPAAKKSGVTLQVDLQPNSRSFVIKKSENAPANFQKVYIVATMNQSAVYMAAADLSQTFVTGGSIPVADLPSGILQLTLFDSGWIPVAERISFINNDEYHFEPEVGFSQLGTEKRKQNTLVINVPDSIATNLSVSVTDARVGIDSSDDIASRLLLTADLKGIIYHPYQYFINNSDSLQKQLDLVMLTNGWRRINWEDIVKGKMPSVKYQNDTDYLSLSGKIFGATSSDLRQGAFVLALIDNKKDTSRRVEQLAIQQNGTFSSRGIILYDTTTVYYKVSGSELLSNSSALNFNNSMPAPAISETDTLGNVLFSDTATENYRRRLAEEQMRLFKMQQGTTLQDVTVTTRAKSAAQLLDEKYTSPLFSSGDAYQFDVVDDPLANNSMSVLEYLRGKVAGLQIVTGTGSSNGSATWRGGTPTFYLNESPVDMSLLTSTNMSDVAYIKVFRPPFMGSIGGGANGAIAVYTRRGGDEKKAAGKGLPYKILIGYTAQKEFYSPDYASFNSRNEDRDLRTTLYWNPMILTTTENHTIRLRFYNSDVTESFRVIVEGITADGRLTHVEKVVE